MRLCMGTNRFDDDVNEDTVHRPHQRLGWGPAPRDNCMCPAAWAGTAQERQVCLGAGANRRDAASTRLKPAPAGGGTAHPKARSRARIWRIDNTRQGALRGPMRVAASVPRPHAWSWAPRWPESPHPGRAAAGGAGEPGSRGSRGSGGGGGGACDALRCGAGPSDCWGRGPGRLTARRALALRRTPAPRPRSTKARPRVASDCGPVPGKGAW